MRKATNRKRNKKQETKIQPNNANKGIQETRKEMQTRKTSNTKKNK